MKSSIICFTIVPMLLTFSNVSLTMAGEPSKEEATELIQKHIGGFYLKLPTQCIADPSKNLHDIIKAQNFGVITTVLKSAVGTGSKDRNLLNGAQNLDVFEIMATQKAQDIPHFTTPDNKIIAFQIMNRKIDEIVQIEKNNSESFTVYFTYSATPNPFGRAMGFDKEAYKYKGKAIVLYDIFIKQYLFSNFYYSSWDRLEWQPTNWVSIEDGKQVLRETK